jgi:hypothetical protein
MLASTENAILVIADSARYTADLARSWANRWAITPRLSIPSPPVRHPG